MPLRHHPEDEKLFAALLRTGGDRRLLARLGVEAAQDIRRLQTRRRFAIAVVGLGIGAALVPVLASFGGLTRIPDQEMAGPDILPPSMWSLVDLEARETPHLYGAASPANNHGPADTAT